MVWVKAIQTKIEDEFCVNPKKIPSYFHNETQSDLNCFGCGQTIPMGAHLENISRPRCFDCGGEFLPPLKEEAQESKPLEGAIPFGTTHFKCNSCNTSLTLTSNNTLVCFDELCSSNKQLASCQSNSQDNAAAPQNSSHT